MMPGDIVCNTCIYACVPRHNYSYIVQYTDKTIIIHAHMDINNYYINQLCS